MVTEHPNPWLLPGYGDITAARVVGNALQVDFANGDVVDLQLQNIGLQAGPRTQANVEDGLAVRVDDGNQVVEVTWARIRSASDPAYAQHLSGLAAEESKRLGRRLRALREDRGITQSQLAHAAQIPQALLSRIEKGVESVRVSTLRELLHQLGAGIADMAGPDVPEVSIKTILANAEKAGVPRPLGAALASGVPRRDVARVFARAFTWSRDALFAGVPETPPLAIPVQFKATQGQHPENSPLVHLAFSTARLARKAFDVPEYRRVPDNPRDIWREAVDQQGHITLASLLNWAWNRGIAVLPLSGSGGFTAAVMPIDGTPTIVLKETRELAVYWLFDLAHELGHIGRGHVTNALVDVQSPTSRSPSDVDEQSATAFALDLLLPNHRTLLEEIRADARGDGVRFKFSVERVAGRAGISSGLLGIVAAFELSEVGRPLDRWGSATNLAKSEGAVSGRDQAVSAARQRAALHRLDPLEEAQVRAVVLGGANEQAVGARAIP